ncbi:MAG: signal peptide peptidase SppA [Nanoarchaeota archaeon]|nr:signal peptide peptidase SppA [Nanoarchaeota archaeon]
MEIAKTIKVFVTLLLFTILTAFLLGKMFETEYGNVALIKIYGEISFEESPFEKTANADKIIDNLKEAKENPVIKALLIEINSPGGTVVATRNIANYLKSINKTKVCLLKDVATSGAYWIASACDVIVSDEYTITGSIGVTASYLEFSKFFEKYGINYVRIVSGEEKDIGTPFREPTEKEIKNLQDIINEMHKDFIKDVAENRNLSIQKVSEIADGSIFTGKKALELGLIDVLGDKEKAIQIIKQRTNLTQVKLVEHEEKISFVDLLSQFLSKNVFSMSKLKISV